MLDAAGLALTRVETGTVGIGAVLMGAGAGTVAVGGTVKTAVGKATAPRATGVVVGAMVGRETVFVADESDDGRSFPGPEHATSRTARRGMKQRPVGRSIGRRKTLNTGSALSVLSSRSFACILRHGETDIG